MQFDRRFGVVVAVSLAWACVVSAAFYRVAGGSGGRTRAASRKEIVVATRPLAAGSMLDRDSLKLRGVPDELVPAGAFARVEDVLERPVISAIQQDEPVVEARLAVKGSGAGLGPMIPPGMRAISVRVNDVVGVAGFVLPGMRVDVLVTGKPPNRAETETQTVLQNITVLSAGQTIQSDPKSQPIMAPVVTLLVTPEEAEALTLANSEGRIQLVLRNSTDRVSAATRGRKLRELYGAAPAPETAMPKEEAPPPRARTAHAVTRKALPADDVSVAQVQVQAPVQATEAAMEQMVVIRGSVKTVEVFRRDGSPK